MLSTAVVTGAAPTWVAARLNASQHEGTVVHAGSDALYFRSHGDVIGVTSRHATPLPCTISTRLATVHDLFENGHPPSVGDEVIIGAGVLELGVSHVRVGRYADFTMRTFDLAEAGRMRELLAEAAGVAPQPDEIDATVLATLGERPTDGLMQVLGIGSGLTPFGDDVVSGMMAVLLAGGDPCAAALCEHAIALAPARTTSLSTTLLRRAAVGDVLPAFSDVVTALLDEPDRAPTSIARLLTIGHTSGAGMLLGLNLALDHIITRSCP